MLSYLVRRRTHEMGIRAALGARPRTVVSYVVGSAMRLALPGVIIGLIGAWLLTRLIATLLFGVSPTDAITFAGVALLLTSMAAIASLVPARRATKRIRFSRCEVSSPKSA